MVTNRNRQASRLPKYVREHHDGFRAVVTLDGERVRSPTFPTTAQAAKWAKAVLRDHQQHDAVRNRLTLQDAFDLLLDDLQETDARQGTIDYYSTHWNTVRAAFGADTWLHAIEPADVQQFVRARRDKGISGATIVQKELGLLRRLLRLARREGYPLPVDAFTKVKLPKVRPQRFGYLTQEQVAQAVATMRQNTRGQGTQWADVVELLFGTGIRRAELIRLRTADIDLDRGHLTIDGKTGTRHQVFGKSLEPVLRRMIDRAQKDGHLVTRNGVIWAFTHWRRKLDLPEFSPHVLRHSYGTAMAERVSQWQLMGLMGHTNLKQTARYYHARGDDVRGALDGLALDPPSPPSPDGDA